MRTVRHTPRPWRTDGRAVFAAPRPQEPARHLLVAVAARPDTPALPGLAVPAPLLLEAQANAHLIALAPELLDLCRRARAELSDWPQSEAAETGAGGNSETARLLLDLAGAIARAEGRAT
jgi:hypothetical protein